MEDYLLVVHVIITTFHIVHRSSFIDSKIKSVLDLDENMNSF